MTNDGGQEPEDPEPEAFGVFPEADDAAGEDPTADHDDPDLPDEAVETGPHTALPPKVEAWRRRSATGAVLTGFALGLQQALGKEQEQPAIIMQTSGDPPKDLPVEAEVEQGRPRQSVVNIRPWLLPDRPVQTNRGAEAESDEGVAPDAGGASVGDLPPGTEED